MPRARETVWETEPRELGAEGGAVNVRHEPTLRQRVGALRQRVGAFVRRIFHRNEREAIALNLDVAGIQAQLNAPLQLNFAALNQQNHDALNALLAQNGYIEPDPVHHGFDAILAQLGQHLGQHLDQHQGFGHFDFEFVEPFVGEQPQQPPHQPQQQETQFDAKAETSRSL